MTTTTATAPVVTLDTFRRIIGDTLAAFDRATIANRADNGGLWADRHETARAVADVARTALGMVEEDAFFGPAVDDDGLAAEVASILDDGPNGAGIDARDPVAIVDAIRDAVRRGPADGMGNDDRCGAHGAGPVDGGAHGGFAGTIYTTRYACGCTEADMSGDTIDAVR